MNPVNRIQSSTATVSTRRRVAFGQEPPAFRNKRYQSQEVSAPASKNWLKPIIRVVGVLALLAAGNKGLENMKEKVWSYLQQHDPIHSNHATEQTTQAQAKPRLPKTIQPLAERVEPWKSKP